MKLAHVSLGGVRGVTIELPLAGKPCFCVTGPAGSGKTTVLEAIAGAKEVAGCAGHADSSRTKSPSSSRLGRRSGALRRHPNGR